MSERHPQHSRAFDNADNVDNVDDTGDYVDVDDAAFDHAGGAADPADGGNAPVSGAPEPPRGWNASAASGYEPNRRYPDAAQGISTGMKAGWVALGFVLGLFSLIVVLLLYARREPELRSAALRYTVMGLVAGVLAEFLLINWLMQANPEIAGQIATATTASPGSEGWTSSNF